MVMRRIRVRLTSTSYSIFKLCRNRCLELKKKNDENKKQFLENALCKHFATENEKTRMGCLVKPGVKPGVELISTEHVTDLDGIAIEFTFINELMSGKLGIELKSGWLEIQVVLILPCVFSADGAGVASWVGDLEGPFEGLQSLDVYLLLVWAQMFQGLGCRQARAGSHRRKTVQMRSLWHRVQAEKPSPAPFQRSARVGPVKTCRE